MVLCILILITVAFLGINYVQNERDFMHPAVIFCGVFLLSEIVCLLGMKAFAVQLHISTLLVLSIGFLIFTLVAILVKKNKRNALVNVNGGDLAYIDIPHKLLLFLIIFQIATYLAFIYYLYAVSRAYGSSSYQLSEWINIFDTLTKFMPDQFQALAVPIPMVYRIGNPVTSAAAYLVLYVAVNNFMATKKINWYHVIVVALLCVGIILNGSRTPLFRIFTMVLLLAYVFHGFMSSTSGSNRRFFLKLAGASLAFVVCMLLMVSVIRPSAQFSNVGQYLFIYLGAPLVNLDTFLSHNVVKIAGGISTIFGAQTFRTLYVYVAKHTDLTFLVQPDINFFSFSNNGIEIGNVYTAFYKYIYDFGYLGIVPLTAIVAGYYILTYQRICAGTAPTGISFRLFIYAYLFNDLVMQFFSNRFYETVLDAPFLKLLLLAWLLEAIFFKKKLKLGKKQFDVEEIQERLVGLFKRSRFKE